MAQGVLAVVSGFSGAGKGTIMKALLKKYDNYALSVSATTRSPREGEENGREYFFVDEAQFQRMIENDELLEYAGYVNHYYGTPRPYVEKMLSEGKDVLLEIEIQGALKVREKFPEAVLIFIVAPSAEALKERLAGRGTEDEAVIEKRLRRAIEESDGMEQYDYILVNDSVEDCVERLHRLLESQHLRVGNNGPLIERMRTELKALAQ